MVHKIQSLILVENGVDSGAGKRIASVSRTVVAGHKRALSDLLSEQESADGNSAAQCLGAGHDIRADAEAVPGKHGTRAPHAALDLVKDQEDSLFITERPQAFQKLLRSRQKAALALNGLDDDCAGLLCDQNLHAFKIVQTGELHIAGHLAEGFTVVGIAGDRKRAVGPAVEGIFHGDHLMTPVPVL